MAFKGGSWGAAILGILSIVFGIIVIVSWASPAAMLTYIWTVAILALAGGLGQIYQAITRRSVAA